MDAKSVRKAFLDFYATHGHEVVRSSPLVLAGDPTLLFANAGMNQFKDVFTGAEPRAIRRATSAQKCVRAGGKHNDLENVGFTARHHTFFEMLGNFSFGDYFKEEAIRWAWDLVRALGIDTSRLAFTVFGGDPSLPGLGADDEARALWRGVTGCADDRVISLGAKDNFWQMGDVGPMGPCSELHYFQGDDLPCTAPTCAGPACDCDRWLEIWNLVFMQYERRIKDGPLTPLPAPSVDTGAGLERMTSVAQGQRSNYDTDLFAPLLARAAELARRTYGKDAADDASMRVIADHARATAFLISDGVFPEKTGREYVLRRIFRRAVRHGKRLGIEEPFMHLVCGTVIDELGDVYPELTLRRKVIEQLALTEETNFRRTLDRGLTLLEDEFARLATTGDRVVPGARVFQLYDTYGFPADLTAVIAAERGIAVDQPGFDAALRAAQERSEFKGQEDAVSEIWKSVGREAGATRFLGHGHDDNRDGTLGTGRVLALVVDGARAARAVAGQKVGVVCDATPFYGAAGGQVGDTGWLACAGARVRVDDTVKPTADSVLHLGVVETGTLTVGDEVAAQVDTARRDRIRANHSATHLLHLALRTVLGDHATQKGSLVAPERLRFDFAHGAPLTDEERRRVETLVNDDVRKNVASDTEVMALAEAKRRGAMQMFGEKYGETVRVVRIGGDSLEFCGGTHVRRAGDIGLFKIVTETGIAQGVRRIEAVTGVGAESHVQRMEDELLRAGERLKSGPLEVADRVERLLAELRTRDREVAELMRKLAAGGGRDLLAEVKDVGGVKVLACRVDVADPKTLRETGDALRDRLGSGIVVLAGEHDGKVAIVAMVSKDLVARFHAGKIVGAVAELVGGRGGGRPDMAQAGGTDPTRLDEALARVYAIAAV
ncbi:MAG: alanine--tRNA ligase [Myxococcales bacterium]|nr:alanine--tRNA ligase [Myxococcales bacterium]